MNNKINDIVECEIVVTDDNLNFEVCDNLSLEKPVMFSINNFAVGLDIDQCENVIATMLEILNQKKYRNLGE